MIKKWISTIGIVIVVQAALLTSTCVSANHHAEMLPLTVADAKVRAVIPGASNTAGYLTLTNTSDKPIKLVSAQSSIAKRVEFHQHLHQNGLMKMIKLDEVVVPANGELVFESGGLHIMFLGVSPRMTDEKSATVTLVDDSRHTFDVTFSIESLKEKMRPMGMKHDKMNHEKMKNKAMDHSKMDHGQLNDKKASDQ